MTERAPAFDIERFVRAQDPLYSGVLAELRAGAKRSHWIWFVFPQIARLGHSQTARFYGIASLGEAQAYLQHRVLRPRLVECTEAMLAHAGKKSAVAILGEIDALKFASSMTLFEAAGGPPCLGEALDRFYSGARDARTLDLLKP